MTDQFDQTPIPLNLKTPTIKSVCLYSLDYQDALSHLRIIGPLRQLGLNVIHGVENGQIFIERALGGDIVVLQRDFPKEIDAYEKILALARQKEIPLILDLDDLLFELPEDHPDRLSHAFTGTLLPIFQAILEVDLVTVTTRPLSDFVLGYNKNVWILPNYLDDEIWQLKPPVRSTSDNGKVIIGYMGGHTHQPDLEILISVMKDLIQRYPDKLELQFWGTEPPGELSAYPFVHWHDQITWNYRDFAAFFQTQFADIFVAPLADNKFNNCKSSIKYLEYGSLGVPGVFSKVEPYISVINHGENGFLASSAKEWVDCLVQLIENPDLRFSLASNAQADIKSNWLLSQKAPLWLSAYQKAYEFRSSRTPVDSIYLQMIKNLTHQTVSWHQDTTHQLEIQSHRITELEYEVAQKDATITGITNSKTWKLALAFRHIRNLIAPPNGWLSNVTSRILRIFSAKNDNRID